MSEMPGIDANDIKARLFSGSRPPDNTLWHVAYSGGLDSTVLLHLLCGIRDTAGIRLRALHADHGLQANSEAWRRHCAAHCRELGVELVSTRLAVADAGEGGPEARARTARYRWFREVVGAGGRLVTAHHLGDQAETVIERLSRGTGTRGLRGMLPRARLLGMWVYRPLLGTPRDTIHAYAERHRLNWVEDHSNRDEGYTRNFIRRRVLPVLAARWPHIDTALARSAMLMADADEILRDQALADLGRVAGGHERGDAYLPIPPLQALSAARRRNLLRCWLRREAGSTLGYEPLKRIDAAVERYPRDAGGLRWPPLELRSYRGRLYLLSARRLPDGGRRWDARGPLCLGAGMTLRPRPVHGHGLRRALLASGVEVRFRRGGERCRLPGRAHHHSLKQILQEARVPPWQRARVPLLLVDGEIIAVAGVLICAPGIAGPQEAGIEVEVAYRAPGGSAGAP